MRYDNGFTLVELLVVIAIIAILTSILVPSLGYVMERAQRAKVKATITQLEQAVFNYKTEYGGFPPDGIKSDGSEDSKDANGGDIVGSTYKYKNDTLVKYLCGESQYGVNKLPLHDFQEQYLKKTAKGKTVYLDEFEEPYRYHNFHDDTPLSDSKDIDDSHPLHPWYNRVNFQSVQIYSRANGGFSYEDNAYGDNAVSAQNFLWITNYTK